MHFDCKVKFSAGAYSTNTVRGCRGSSTAGAETAVRRLADRLYGDRSGLIERIECLGEAVGGSTWRMYPVDERQPGA